MYLEDPLGRKVIVLDKELKKPSDYKGEYKTCPFCPETMHKNADPIFVDKDIWDVRIIPNKYPVGEHNYVIVHREENIGIESEKYLKELGLASKFMVDFSEKLDKYCVIFKNKGHLSGASVKHPHDQAFLSDTNYVKDEKALNDYIKKELSSDRALNEYAICPKVSIFSYETWVFLDGDSLLSSSGWEKVSKVYKAMKRVMKKDFDYNLLLYYSRKDKFPPFIDIIPRTVIPGAPYILTGASINPTPPNLAAEKIKKFL